MSDDDPHVERTIRTPQAIVTIRGSLSAVDRIYRTANTALLATGYTIPKPTDDPWREYGRPPVDDTDHLRRRVADLEQALTNSHDHNLLQELRRTVLALTLERDEWRQAFIDLDKNVQLALYSLKDDPEPNLYSAVALEFLS